MKNFENNYQRLVLLNQYKILRDLAQLNKNQDKEKECERIIEVMSKGYEEEYEQLFEEVSDEFSKEESEFVYNILDVYSNIKFSYEKLENPTIDINDISFPGFDALGEGKYLSFCKYLFFKLNTYKPITENGRTDFNSHSRYCDKYRRMIAKWHEMNKPCELTEEQMRVLLEA